MTISTPSSPTEARDARREAIEAKVRVSEKAVPLIGGQLAASVLIALPIILVIWTGFALVGVLSAAAQGVSSTAAWLPGGLFIVSLLLLSFVGYQQPNVASVYTLFGNYIGTVTRTGLFVVPIPFAGKKSVSLAQSNFESETLKINDARGNPLSVSAVVVYRVDKPAQAMFSVDNFRKYLSVQVEGALRHVVSNYPYHSSKADEKSLLANLEDVNEELISAIATATAVAGVEVVEARINNLSYSIEIAQSMLQRQQAEAILDARELLVAGSVGIVEDAVKSLATKDIKFSESEKTALVTNLLTVLVGDRSAQPVIDLK